MFEFVSVTFLSTDSHLLWNQLNDTLFNPKMYPFHNVERLNCYYKQKIFFYTEMIIKLDKISELLKNNDLAIHFM